MSFVNEIDEVVYILTVLSFFIFIGCYYLFRALSLSFYYTYYCKILLYYIYYLYILLYYIILYYIILYYIILYYIYYIILYYIIL